MERKKNILDLVGRKISHIERSMMEIVETIPRTFELKIKIKLIKIKKKMSEYNRLHGSSTLTSTSTFKHHEIEPLLIKKYKIN